MGRAGKRALNNRLCRAADAILGAVINAENLDDALVLRGHAIDDHVWQADNHELARTRNETNRADQWRITQKASRVPNTGDNPPRCRRISLLMYQ